MADENPSRGEERIANELLLKLGLRVSPRTIRRDLPKSPAPGGNPRRDQRWSTFLKNHAQDIVACDFCVVATATFKILYVLVVMEHASRRIIHVNVTAIRPQPGPFSSCVRRSPQTTVIALSSTTATRSFRPDSMLRWRICASAGGCAPPAVGEMGDSR